MRVLLLIAGRSVRFWPLSEKTLFPICGTNLLEITTGRLKSAGLTDITLIGGTHNLELVREKYPEFSIVEQKDLSLGMRGALLDALPEIGSGPVMIVCVNDVIDPSAYKNLIDKCQSPDVQGALLAQKVDRYFPGGYLQIDGERITSIIEKPKEGNEPSDLVNIVAHVHKDSSVLLEALKQAPAKDDGYEIALDQLFKKYIYSAVPFEGVWQAIKYPWHMLNLLPMLLSKISEQKIHESAQVHPTAVIDGSVIMSEGVKVFPHATVRGPCYIGPNSIVANNALVRDSSIGSDCVVGYSSEVKASVFADHVWTHTTYIGDSVVGSNVSFGAGSATGNLRLDEAEISSIVKGEKIKTGLNKFGTIIGADCRLGIHTGINPGIKIGSGTFISSHVLVSEDVPDKSFVTMKKDEMRVRENKIGVPGAEKREGFRNKTIGK
jgi:bifunctional UDP-N-acetylglucosamine pyrophosphorylase/glucosamine-1-phosphate N-acetyltransferase|tara:strand:+ start:2795 stop:4102 length:1308 start_codon:yes stop_codon:yes gene_type:complete